MRIWRSILLAVLCLYGSSARADQSPPPSLDDANLDELVLFYVRMAGKAAGEAYVCNYERLAEYIAHETNTLVIITATYDKDAGAWRAPRLSGSSSWQEHFAWGIEHGFRSVMSRTEGCGRAPWSKSIKDSEQYQLRIYQRNEFHQNDPSAPPAVWWARPKW